MTQPVWFFTASDLFRQVRERWPLLAVFGIVGGGTGAGVALLLPSYYRASAAFQAESSTPLPLGGALAGLATQLGGLSVGGGMNNAHLFGDLLRRDAVLRKVSAATFPWKGQPSPLATIYGIDSRISGLRDYYTVRRLRKAVDVDVNARTGVVTFSVEARTPELALALTETTLVALNDANIALRQSRARAERLFTSARAESAKVELTNAENTLAVFHERNRSFQSSPALAMEEARLRRVVDMAQQVYVELRLQEEQAAVQEVRNTPAISILDPPILPARRSRPKRRTAALSGLAIGLALGLVRLTIRS